MIECQYYKPPRPVVDPVTDKDYESSAWCDLIDKHCSLEYNGKCDEYEEFLKEKTLGDVLIGVAKRIKETKKKISSISQYLSSHQIWQLLLIHLQIFVVLNIKCL